MKTLKSIIISFDTLLGVVVFSLAAIYLSPSQVPAGISSLYGIALIIQAIFVFISIFMVVDLVASDRDFIAIIKNPDRIFTELIRFYWLSIALIFCTIIANITLYALSLFQSNTPMLFALFLGTFAYSIGCIGICIDCYFKIKVKQIEFIARNNSDKYKKPDATDKQSDGK